MAWAEFGLWRHIPSRGSHIPPCYPTLSSSSYSLSLSFLTHSLHLSYKHTHSSQTLNLTAFWVLDQLEKLWVKVEGGFIKNPFITQVSHLEILLKAQILTKIELFYSEYKIASFYADVAEYFTLILGHPLGSHISPLKPRWSRIFITFFEKHID